MAHSPIIVQVEENRQDVEKAVTDVIANEISLAKKTGSTMAFILSTEASTSAMYSFLIELFYQGKLDFSKATFFSLDYNGSNPAETPSFYTADSYNHFIPFITNQVTMQKLHYWGLKPLTKNLCHNKRKRKKLNESLDHFCQRFITNCNENPNTLEAFEKTTSTFQEQDPLFANLILKYMDDKQLPSMDSLRGWIQQEVSLRSHATSDSQIHSGYESSRTLSHCLEDPSCQVTFIGDVKTLNACISYASSSSSEETHHLLCFKDNLQNMLDCPRMFIVASGSQEQEMLYQLLDKQAPFPVLENRPNGSLTFLVDEKAYGCGQPNSLFSLCMLGALNLDSQNPVQIKKSTQPNFWDVPQLSKPSLLDKGNSSPLPNISYVQCPSNQIILWVKKGKVKDHLWKKLKANNNTIHTTQEAAPSKILDHIKKIQPDIVMLPHNEKMLENFSQFRNSVIEENFPKPILGIFYETKPHSNNMFLPLSKVEYQKKMSIIFNFHPSQVAANRLDLIAGELSSTQSPASQYNEIFSFFDLTYQQKQLQLIPFSSKSYIVSSKSTKKKLRPSFSFNPKDTAVIISPHPNDAELSLGGLLHHLGREGIETKVLNVTSGNNAPIPKKAVIGHPYLPTRLLVQVHDECSEFVESIPLKATIREYESMAALSQFNPQAQLLQLRLPFYDDPSFQMSTSENQKVDELFQKNIDTNASRVFFFLPYPQDSQITHRMIHEIFFERVCNYYKKNPHKKIIVALYPTPWTGQWNLYNYSTSVGSKLAALSGSELLAGDASNTPETLGGLYAKRYHLFVLNK